MRFIRPSEKQLQHEFRVLRIGHPLRRSSILRRAFGFRARFYSRAAPRFHNPYRLYPVRYKRRRFLPLEYYADTWENTSLERAIQFGRVWNR